MILHFDLVIFGAGPAGSACAIRARLAGLSVLLLERQAFPRYRPGESLHPGIDPILRQLGIDLEATKIPIRRFSGIWQCPPDADAFLQPFSDRQDEWLGYQISRADLDCFLLEAARDLGAQTLVGVQAKLEARKPTWQIKVNNQRYSADILIDATGGQVFTKRHLGLVMRRHSLPLFLRFGYVQVRGDGQREAEFQTLADGWLYQAQIDTDTRHWCRLSPKRLPRNYCPEHLMGLPKLGVDRDWDATWQSHEPFADSDYFLVGDAAYRLDPSSSHGVLKALMSGIYVAHLLEHQRKQDISRQVAARLYRQFLGKWMAHDLAILRRTEWYKALDTDECTSPQVTKW